MSISLSRWCVYELGSAEGPERLGARTTRRFGGGLNSCNGRKSSEKGRGPFPISPVTNQGYKASKRLSCLRDNDQSLLKKKKSGGEVAGGLKSRTSLPFLPTNHDCLFLTNPTHSVTTSRASLSCPSPFTCFSKSPSRFPSLSLSLSLLPFTVPPLPLLDMFPSVYVSLEEAATAHYLFNNLPSDSE